MNLIVIPSNLVYRNLTLSSRLREKGGEGKESCFGEDGMTVELGKEGGDVVYAL